MNSENIKIGNIYRKEVTYTQKENLKEKMFQKEEKYILEQQNQILIEARNGKYIELKNTKSLLIRLGLIFGFLQTKQFLQKIDAYDYGTHIKYVDDLIPYVSTSTKISLKQARIRNK